MFKLSVLVLQKSFQANFVEAEVRVVDCPDLRQAPFCLTGKGKVLPTCVH